MKYQIGDTVLLLHSDEEGEVVEILNDKMVLVDVEGVRFPVYLDQIDFPYFKRFTEKKIIRKKENLYVDDLKKEKITERSKVAPGIWLSLLPVFDKNIFEEDVVEKFKIYLINQTDDELNFRYQINFKGAQEFHLANHILPLSDFYLHDINFEEMNDSPKFEFDFSLAKPDRKKPAHFESSLKIKAKQLFQKIEQMKMKNEPTFSFLLLEKYPDKQQDLAPSYSPSGGRIYNASKGSPFLDPPRSVIDLHIEKVTDNWKGLSHFEILTLQLNYFEKYYNLAVAHRQPNLIVIHGVGSGKLRNEIHEILKTKKEVRTFANQYHSDFGFGATEIFFQY